MSAGRRKKQETNAVSSNVFTNEDWDATLATPGLKVVDVYAKWAGTYACNYKGPCEAMQSIFKRLKLQYNEAVNFSQAATDDIKDLERFRNKSCPTFLFYFVNI